MNALNRLLTLLRIVTPSPIKNFIRPIIRFLRTAKFLASYKFLPPPEGTDLTGYECLLRVWEDFGLAEVEGDVVEIGAFLGGGTYKLAKYLERRGTRKTVYAIDIFDPNTDMSKCTLGVAMADLYKQAINRAGKGLSQWEVFQHVTRNCKNIRVIKGDTKEIQLPINRICFAFVDGNHEPSYVMNDFYLVWPRLTEGGVIAFDDYGYDLLQVTFTINELLGKHAQDITVIVRQGKVIFLQKQTERKDRVYG